MKKILLLSLLSLSLYATETVYSSENSLIYMQENCGQKPLFKEGLYGRNYLLRYNAQLVFYSQCLNRKVNFQLIQSNIELRKAILLKK